MRWRKQMFAMAAVAVSVFGAQVAHGGTYVDSNGDTVEDGHPDLFNMSWHDAAMASGIGVEFAVGGGFTGFTDRTLRDITSSLGGSWNTRISVGTHIPLAFEALYNGSATSIGGVLGQNTTTLLGTTFEGDVRFNLMPHFVVVPYVFAGIGWQHYSLSDNGGLSDAGIVHDNSMLDVPMGIGVAYRLAGFVAEARGTFRATTDSNFALENSTIGNTQFVHMQSWDANINIGYEW